MITPLEPLVGSNIQNVGSDQGSLAAKERKGRKDQAMYFYAICAFFRGKKAWGIRVLQAERRMRQFECYCLLVPINLQGVGSSEGSLAAKQRKGRKEEAPFSSVRSLRSFAAKTLEFGAWMLAGWRNRQRECYGPLAQLTRGLLLAAIVAASGGAGLHAADTSKFDPSKQNDQLAPTPERTDTRLAPNQKANQRPIERNSRLQDQRFQTPEKIERKDAAVGEKRAPIELKETREKNKIERKDAPKPELKTWDKNRHDGEKSDRQPKGDQIKKYEMADKFQGRITDAKTAAAQRQPKMEKQTSFEKINRFLFKRNGPGTEDGKAMVTTAGGGSTPPPSQDTYTKYRVDWSKGKTLPEE